MHLLAVDPGNTTGWALFIDNPIPVQIGEMSIDEFYDWLNNDTLWKENPLNQIVLEDYIIRPEQFRGFDHTWSRVPTVQVIGAVQCFARRYHVPVHLSQASLLSPAAKRFHVSDPKNRRLKNRNAISALIHGRLWFEKQGLIQLKNSAQPLQAEGPPAVDIEAQ